MNGTIQHGYSYWMRCASCRQQIGPGQRCEACLDFRRTGGVTDRYGAQATINILSWPGPTGLLRKPHVMVDI